MGLKSDVGVSPRVVVHAQELISSDLRCRGVGRIQGLRNPRAGGDYAEIMVTMIATETSIRHLNCS